ncbi:MAG: hypothetical protein Q8936_08880 [Bacillota bacterium]|nr:hypothetical protein [Bacillota bacterium]
MINKKFLYGVGIGVLGCNIYPLIKDKLRPVAVKMVEGAIAAGSTTKSFIEEVNREAIEQRQHRYKKRAEDFENESLNNNMEVSENIELLKKQIEELQARVNKV